MAIRHRWRLPNLRVTRREAATALVLPLLAAAAEVERHSPKVLIVVAHPDDEYYFAATTYRLAQELGATVDQVVITNGEGGYRYSTLAEKIYGVKLTDERTGRSHLPEIRRRETLAAGKILGIRHHHFLSERDERFTLNAGEADQIWNCQKVRHTLRDLLQREKYDFVFTMLPRASTHGHHQAATLLALEVVQTLDPAQRPVVLGAEPRQSQETEPFSGLDGQPLTATAHPDPTFAFDRRQHFGFHDAIAYDVVVHWVIAEHKSQGMFQNDVGKHDVERFWRFALGPADGEARTASLAQRLRRSQ